MKKIICFIFLICINQINGQTYVTINDTALVNYYHTIIPGAMNGNQLNTSSTLVTTTTHSINISNHHTIHDVNSFKYFTSLTYLNCNKSAIDSLNFIPAGLIYLDITNAYSLYPNTNPPPLNYGTINSLILPNSLKYFYCGDNLSVSGQVFLPPLPNSLTYLNVNGGNVGCQLSNQTYSLPSIPSTVDTLIVANTTVSGFNHTVLPASLIYLNCFNMDCDSLPNMPASLKYLNCGYNCQLKYIPSLVNTSLDTLISSEDIHLSFLPPLPNSLKYLQCKGDNLALLPTLPNSLTFLDCSRQVNNLLIALPALPGSLQTLLCQANPALTSIPALPSSLKYLNCGKGNYSGSVHLGLKTLPALPNGLTTLICNYDSISCLPNIPNTVTTFSAQGNFFTCYPNYIAAMGSNPGYPICSYNCQPAETPAICMVTTDSSSSYRYNVIVWDKTLYQHVDSFVVYRYDGISSSYLRIGAVSGGNLSEFKDTSFNIGGPNGGNPLYASWKYVLQIRDSLGNYSAQSNPHQTMFVQQNGSNFAWNYYSGSAITSYSLLRDDNNTGNWQVLVNTTSNAATDPMYSSYPNANWRVDAVGFNCSSTLRLANNNSVQKTYLKAHSNTIKPLMLNISKVSDANYQVTIYPNPTTGNFTIRTNTSSKQTLQIVDINGKIVLTQTINGITTINASNINEGVYNLNIICNEGVTNKRLVIVK